MMGKLLEPFGSWLFMAIFVNIPKKKGNILKILKDILELMSNLKRYFVRNYFN